MSVDAAPDMVPAPIVNRADRGVWAAVVDSDPAALPEQTPEWVDAICDGSRYTDVSRSYLFADGRRFVLPLVTRRGMPRAAEQLWSFPNAWGIGGPVGTGLDRHVVDHIAADLRGLGAARVSIRIDPRDDIHWRHIAESRDALVLPRTAHVAELLESPEAHLASISSRTRYNLRKAERKGVRLETGFGGELLDDHYGLFLSSVERWAGRQHEPLAMARWRAARRDPLAKLRSMSEHLGDRFVVVVAFIDGRPAASAIMLLGPTTRYTRSAIDVELSRGTCASDAVQWRALELAYQHGARWYNMGESGSSAGLAEYKERFGAVAVPYGEYRFERIPITRVDRAARGLVKRVVGFKD